MTLKLPGSFEKAVKLLYYRNYFSDELEQKLLEFGYTEKEIKVAIHKCIDGKYMNDEVYAKDYIENALAGRRWGYNKIQYKMSEKGVPSEKIKQYLSAYYSKEKEAEIKELIIKEKEKKLPVEIDSFKKKGILQRLLFLKGF